MCRLTSNLVILFRWVFYFVGLFYFEGEVRQIGQEEKYRAGRGARAEIIVFLICKLLRPGFFVARSLV